MDELFNEMCNLWDEFYIEHVKAKEKNNKAAARRARTAIGGLKRLVTKYRKLSVESMK